MRIRRRGKAASGSVYFMVGKVGIGCFVGLEAAFEGRIDFRYSSPGTVDGLFFESLMRVGE